MKRAKQSKKEKEKKTRKENNSKEGERESEGESEFDAEKENESSYYETILDVVSETRIPDSKEDESVQLPTDPLLETIQRNTAEEFTGRNNNNNNNIKRKRTPIIDETTNERVEIDLTKDNRGDYEDLHASSNKKQKNADGSSKLRTPFSNIGDEFIRSIGLRRSYIKDPVSNQQMLLYLLWRTLYWTRSYRENVGANTIKYAGAVGLICPLKTFVEYLYMMFFKVEPFLPSNPPPDIVWIMQQLINFSRGSKKIVRICPVTDNYTEKDLDINSVNLFDAQLGIFLTDIGFCKKLEDKLENHGGRSEHNGITFEVNVGLLRLHRSWVDAEIFNNLREMISNKKK